MKDTHCPNCGGSHWDYTWNAWGERMRVCQYCGSSFVEAWEGGPMVASNFSTASCVMITPGYAGDVAIFGGA